MKMSCNACRERGYENRYFLIIAVVLTIGCVLPPAPDVPRTTHRIYNEHSRYKGRVDASGRIYNEHGRYEGRVDSNGRIYDQHGRYEGMAK